MNAQIFYLNWDLANQPCAVEAGFYKAVNDIICGLATPCIYDVTSTKLYDRVAEVDIGNEVVYEKVDGDLIPMETLESIYHDLQNGIGRGTEAVTGRTRRSMSVGDVVKVNNGWYVVAGCGFKAVA